MLIPVAVTIQIGLFSFFSYFFNSQELKYCDSTHFGKFPQGKEACKGGLPSKFIDIVCRLRDSRMCENYKYVNVVPPCPRARSSPSILINPPKTQHDRKI